MSPSPTATPETNGGHPSAWKTLVPFLSLALAWRLALLIILLAWTRVSPVRMPAPGHYYYHDVPRVTSWVGDLGVRWDSYWYLNIVQFGYRQVRGAESNTAFLPAYPFLIKAASALGLTPAVAGTAISTLGLLPLLIFAFAYAESLYDTRVGGYLLVFLCVFPSSWAFQMVYTESLFCAALFGFLACYHRGHYARAGLLGLILPLTRATGLAVAAAVLADIVLTWRRRRRVPAANLLALTGLAAGVALVSAFYWHTTGEPFGFLTEARSWSTHRQVTSDPIPLLSSLLNNLGRLDVQVYLPALLIYGVGIAILLGRRRDISTLFVAANGLMLLGGSYVSQLRYLLPMLPVHALLVSRLARTRWILVILAAMAAAQLIVTRLYLDWLFVI
jgi:hypothetical protein